MLGTGNARIYNMISITFLVLSFFWLLFVIFQLV